MLGTRDRAKEGLVKWQKEHPTARIGTFEEAVAFGEVVVLCVPGLAAEALVGQLESAIGNKLVIDVTNPVGQGAPVHGVLPFFTDYNDSLMERLQRKAPQAKFVKAFNSAGNFFFYKPSFPGGKPTMFICGNDGDAKATVTQVVDAFGWETQDMGSVEAARAIEPLCMLYCIPGLANNQWVHAFKLLKA